MLISDRLSRISNRNRLFLPNPRPRDYRGSFFVGTLSLPNNLATRNVDPPLGETPTHVTPAGLGPTCILHFVISQLIHQCIVQLGISGTFCILSQPSP